MKRDPSACSLSRGAVRVEVADTRGEQDNLAPPGWVASLTGRATGQDRVRTPHARAALVVNESSGCDTTRVSVSLEDIEAASSADFQLLVTEMITTALVRLRASVHPHPVRAWNFLPGIYDPLGIGVNRYTVFNLARHAAFVGLFGEGAVRTGEVPTASCVGHCGSSISVHVLGTGEGGRAVENPRQTPAFLYSGRYGPRPPCFARATTCRIGGASYLLVGGTASVRGEDSIHDGSRERQLQETLTNLSALIAHAHGPAPSDGALGDILASRVYYKRESDRAWLLDVLPAEFSCRSPPEVVRADICRNELLLEIELLVGIGPPEGLGRSLSTVRPA